MEFLDKIRTPEKGSPVTKQILATAGILILGICLGTFSKFLDHRHAQLPILMRTLNDILDFHNFLGGFAPWIVIAVCISVYSRTAVRAAVNVFVFFTGMVSSYYLYCNFVAGFFPRSYAMIWVGFTILSPILAFICWYAKGKGVIAFLISSGIVGVLMNTAFAYVWFYVAVRSGLNLLMLILGIVILHRTGKETVLMTGVGAVIAVLFEIIVPFHIG